METNEDPLTVTPTSRQVVAAIEASERCHLTSSKDLRKKLIDKVIKDFQIVVEKGAHTLFSNRAEMIVDIYRDVLTGRRRLPVRLTEARARRNRLAQEASGKGKRRSDY